MKKSTNQNLTRKELIELVELLEARLQQPESARAFKLAKQLKNNEDLFFIRMTFNQIKSACQSTTKNYPSEIQDILTCLEKAFFDCSINSKNSTISPSAFLELF